MKRNVTVSRQDSSSSFQPAVSSLPPSLTTRPPSSPVNVPSRDVSPPHPARRHRSVFMRTTSSRDFLRLRGANRAPRRYRRRPLAPPRFVLDVRVEHTSKFMMGTECTRGNELDKSLIRVFWTFEVQRAS